MNAMPTLEVAACHSGKSQSQRESMLSYFRQPGCKVMICTDVYARGLDVSDISVVINYDFPNGVESYVHRIGRTARGGVKTGTSVTLLTPNDLYDTRTMVKLSEVLREAKQPIPELISNSLKSSGGFTNNNGNDGREGGYRGNNNRSFGGNRCASRGG